MKDRSKPNYKRTCSAAVILLLTAGLLLFAARKVPGFAEWYSAHVYPIWQGTLGRLAGAAPFSVAEVLCFLLPVLLIIDIVRNRRRPLRVLVHLLFTVALLFFLYAANCGVNYYRDPFVPRDVYASAAFTDDQLYDFCAYAVDRLNDNSAASGGGIAYPDHTELQKKSRAAMQRLGTEYEGLRGYYPRPKFFTGISGFFSSMGVTGIYSPFTIEANVNGQIPGYNKPFTACHELSHLRGYMNEGEANYIGWLACITSGDPVFERSGWIYAWIYGGRELRKVDPYRFSILRAKLPNDVVRELIANDEFWAAHETAASDVQNEVNDAYLKANGLEDGIASYDRVTTLMLLWYTNQR